MHLNLSSVSFMLRYGCTVHSPLVDNLCVYYLFWSRRKSNDNHFNSPYAAEEFRGTWPSQDIGHIPRVTLTSTSSNDVFGNNLEMVEGPGKKGHSNGMVSTSFQSKLHKKLIEHTGSQSSYNDL